MEPSAGVEHKLGGLGATGQRVRSPAGRSSWIVPPFRACPSTNHAFLLDGIDGYSPALWERPGLDSDCQGGSHLHAWFEFYPHPSNLITTVTVSAGDTISAEVKYVSGKFTLHLTDLTTGKSFSKTAKVSAARSSAEWIAEAPSSSGGVLPLASFGTVHFG